MKSDPKISELSPSTMLLIYNCLRETLEAFDDPSQFSSRIGVPIEFGKEVRLVLAERLSHLTDEDFDVI